MRFPLARPQPPYFLPLLPKKISLHQTSIHIYPYTSTTAPYKMPSLRSIAIAVTLLALGTNTQRVYEIDPDSVPMAIRSNWCVTQKSSCPLLCLQLPGKSATTAANDCDPQSLTYDCVCGNGLSPNASEYSQTLPFFKCQEYTNQCANNCGGNPSCQAACRTDNPCGAQNPTRVNTTTSSATQTATQANGKPQGTDGVVYNGLGGEAEPTQGSDSSAVKGNNAGGSNGAGAMYDLGRSYGLAVVLSGVFAGFALIM